jgi:hypothetical protein
MKQQKGSLGKRITPIARHEPASQAAATEDRSASSGGVGVPHVEGNAECSAGTDQQLGGSRDAAVQNGLKEVEQSEAPLQPTAAGVRFPRCDAAVRKWTGGRWELADAILIECSETGADGVRNESYAKIEAMRAEIAKNHGVELSFERVRKLRQAGSTFSPRRRRMGVSLEGHLEAGTPEALDEIIANAPEGTVLTREFIRRAKHPEEKADQESRKEERRHQVRDQFKALENKFMQLKRENELHQQRYADLCQSTGTDPEPLAPPASQEQGAPRTVAEDLEQSLRVFLTLHGFDPTAAALRQAIHAFVTTVIERQ